MIFCEVNSTKGRTQAVRPYRVGFRIEELATVKPDALCFKFQMRSSCQP